MNKSNNLYLNEFKNIIYSKEKNNLTENSTEHKTNLFIQKTKEKITLIQTLEIPNSELELIETLELLQNHLYISGWKTTFNPNPVKKLERKWSNQLSDCIFKKYKDVLQEFEHKFPENQQIIDFKILTKKLIFKKFLDLIGIV
jgi:hypothetical protein